MGLNSHHIIDFVSIDKVDLDLVGKKAYELGQLKSLGIPIPDGFVITASFFKKFFDLSGLSAKIAHVQSLNHPAIKESVAKLFIPIKKEIMHTAIPQDLAREIYKSYKKISGVFKEQSLNIFTSSLNNKFTVFSDIKGDANLILKIKIILADHLEKPVPVVVQKNIKSKVKGKMLTDDLSISKKNLLTKEQINKLIYYSQKIQKHFYFPQEINYAIEKEKIYITLVKTPIIREVLESKPQHKKLKKILAKGICINPGIVTGPAHVINDQDFTQLKSGEIAVIPELTAKIDLKIKKAKAVVLDAVPRGQDVMYYRKDIRMPTVIGVKNATKILSNGNVITVNGINGEIYQGGLV